MVEWAQRAFHPFAAVDERAVARNPVFKGPGWPYSVDVYTAGANITRAVRLFNDALSGDGAPWLPAASALALRWVAGWDSPGGGAVASGGGAAVAAPGFSAGFSVSLTAPAPGGAAPRKLFIVLTSVAPGGGDRYVEDRVYVMVAPTGGGR